VIAPFGDKAPALDASVYVAPSAIIIGDVTIGPASSIWFHTVLRADIESIRIGARSNVQDNSTIHVVGGRWPTIIGDDVTVGHAVVLHGCTVGNHALIGMGSIVLDGAEIGAECLVGAGAVVTPGTKVAPRGLVLGNPGRRVRDLNADDLERLHHATANYVELAQRYRALGFV
jgi:carbonic anhydrase/acetyltransferase-like protein (isoleucine patch superfamily)